ncbi:MAG: carboxypeptidase-like regulatory domain-containing protein, partial [Methanothrix sp.]|nr:carboxypeptidase-like regulatory domain-containing protein [Methanothrix sp.]
DLSEVHKPGWSQVSAPSRVTLVCSNATNQNFTNQKLLCISGYKLDNCDGPLVGWTITLTNNTYTVSKSTDANGKYEFCGLAPGAYDLSEVHKPGWSQVSAPSRVTLVCSNATNQNFTNQKLLCISGYKLDNCVRRAQTASMSSAAWHRAPMT